MKVQTQDIDIMKIEMKYTFCHWQKGGANMQTLLIVLVWIFAIVFLIACFYKYKKYNRYADRFQETYPDAKNETANTETNGEGKGE